VNITHTRIELKTDPLPFAALLAGTKTNEIRNDDRNFKVGDTLIFRETRFSAVEMATQGAPLEYTGRAQWRFVSHVQRGYGLQDGHVALSFLLADAVCKLGESAPLTREAWACLEDVVSHTQSFDKALHLAYKRADGDDISYWNHERAALARMSIQARRVLESRS
jgi:hypothetical protein